MIEGPEGGRATISGILYQMLRSLAVGCDTVVERLHSGAPCEALLVIEPPAGDLRREDAVPIVEQIKIRRGKKNWSAGDIAEEVFPDLMGAVPQKDAGALRFRFTTDREQGTSELSVYAAAMKQIALEDPDALDNVDKAFRYGRVRYTARGMFDRLAARAGALDGPSRARLWAVLRDFEIVILSEPTLTAQIDSILGVLVDDPDVIALARAKLLADIVEVGKTGGQIVMSQLLSANGLQPGRLLHIARLPGLLLDQAEKDARILQYRGEEEARSSTLGLTALVSVLGGESGQGKTWTLCRTALAVAAAGKPVVLLAARGTLADLETEIVKRVWLSGYDRELPLTVVARRLRGGIADPDGIWLTVYLDDLHDRDLARALIGAHWDDLGIRVVVSAQSSMQHMLARDWQAAVYATPDFSLSELRGCLERADRNPAGIPDDVLDLLARPILASTFIRLPDTEEWADPSEYRLIDQYWRFATSQARDQELHLSDAVGLTALADKLLGPMPRYPFPTRSRGSHLDDKAVGRLMQVGLLQGDAETLSFSHDRFLNWAVAKAVTERALDGALDAEGLDALLDTISSIRTVEGDPLGNRLGYVLLDAVWLLARHAPAPLLAEMLLRHTRRAEARNGTDAFLSQSLATIGAPIVPALRIMLDDSFAGTNEWIWPGRLGNALRRIGRHAPEAVQACAIDLLTFDQGPQRTAAMIVLSRMPAPQAADRLLDIHVENQRAVQLKEQETRTSFAERFARQQASFKALATTARADPAWLTKRIETSEDPDILERLLWVLLNLDRKVSSPIWGRQKGRFFAFLPANTHALLRAIGDFADLEEIERLERAPPDADRHVLALQFDGLVRMDASRALAWLREADLEDLWGTSEWWMDGLFLRTGEAASEALRAHSRRENSKRDPLGFLMTLYRPRLELLDLATLELILDALEQDLRALPEGAEDALEPFWRRLEFLRALPTRAQIDCVHRRRGSELERLLAVHAGKRSGRTTNYVDNLGDYARDILAMMAGDGLDHLALAELSRSNPYGREDGLGTALWSDNAAIGTVVEAFPRPGPDETYREILLHHALAAHRRDKALAQLLDAGAPIYNDTVKIRRSRRPLSDSEAAPYREALRGDDLQAALRAVRMTAFAIRPDLFSDVVDLILRDIGPEVLDEAIGIFRFNGFYDPRLLPQLAERLGSDRQGMATANYLAFYGDDAARARVLAWLVALPDRDLEQQEMTVADVLLDFPDSTPAALDFLHRRLLGRRRDQYAGITLRLAEAGDAEAIASVHSQAFRSPGLFGDHPVHAIRFLARSAPAEAFAAAERLFARHRDISAAQELVRLDPDRAVPLLLEAYEQTDTETRWWLARLLRVTAPRPILMRYVHDMAAADLDWPRQMAAELAGWLPHDAPMPVLDSLAADPVRAVERVALAGLRRRAMEREAKGLIAGLRSAPRALAWVHLRAIHRLVDPYLLWDLGDPIRLDLVVQHLPAEFKMVSKQLRDRAKKRVRDEAKKRDKDLDLD